MSLSRRVTVRMPRPGTADGSGTDTVAPEWAWAHEPRPEVEPRLTWSPLAARPLPSPATMQAPAAEPVRGHGRHRTRRSPGLRVAGFVLGLACLGAAFGGGWLLGEKWAPDHGASIATQWQSTVDGLRDWAMGL